MLKSFTGINYHGPVQAVILDWAGTTMDYGCFAPVEAFQRAFEQCDVPITIQQARAPMGLAKKDHIRAITQMEPVADEWQAVHHRAVNEQDIDELHVKAERALRETVLSNAELIPGVTTFIANLRTRNIRIGSTTGYSSALMQVLVPLARAQGYEPDALVCPDQVYAGRPFPWMALENLSRLRVFPPAAVVKIGDTVPDIQEGLNAGMWTIGVIKSGNEIGLPRDKTNGNAGGEFYARYLRARQKLAQAGAHFIVDTLEYAEKAIAEINASLMRGERP